jgi:recombination protein RecT
MADTAIVKSTTETLRDLLHARTAVIADIVPKHLTPDRLMRLAVNCVAKTPGLQKCTPVSLLQSVLVAAELGLEPGGANGHLYLVPFGSTCTPIVGYRGLIELAKRSGEILDVRAVVVNEKDKFRWLEGLTQVIEHEPFLDGDPGALKHVYCVVTLKSGGTHAERMSKSEVDAIRARSRSGQNGPWVTDYAEMSKKTVARRAMKWCPISSERYEKALEFDNGDYVDGEAIEAPTGEVQASLKDRVAKKTGRMFAIPAEIPAETETKEAT